VDEEIQSRALGIAMQHPVVIGGRLEDSWDELWLSLGEELGWKALGKVDIDALRNGIRVAVEMERLREAGRLSESEHQDALERAQALVARARLAPGEVFDVSHWVGPLLTEGARERLKNVQKEWCQQTGGRHPAYCVSVWDFDDRWIQTVGDWYFWPSAEQVEGTLTELGAPATCRALWLPTPSGDLSYGFYGVAFDPGSRLPLRLALEIAVDKGDSMDLMLLCLPGRLGYIQTHEANRWVVHRPPS
jgi:hypothetical protein